jgi:hypothetical protein
VGNGGDYQSSLILKAYEATIKKVIDTGRKKQPTIEAFLIAGVPTPVMRQRVSI